MHVYVCIYIYMYVYIYMYIHMYISCMCIYIYIYVFIDAHNTYMHVLQRVHGNTSIFEAGSTNVLFAKLLLYFRRKFVDSIVMKPVSITLQVASDYYTHNNNTTIMWVRLKI